MTQIRDFYAKQVKPPPERPSPLLTIAGVVAAFALGGIAVLGWQKLPPLHHWSSALNEHRPTSASPDFSHDRIGRAETAPLLALCLTSEAVGVSADDVPPGTLLQILNAGGLQARVTALLGAKRPGAATSLAIAWGQVADCVYRQNSWNLCDPDNRALAVDAASAFVRNVDEALADASRNPDPSRSNLRDLDNIKERVLFSLKSRIRNGELISADFGPLAPPVVKRVLNETTTVKNGCSGRP